MLDRCPPALARHEALLRLTDVGLATADAAMLGHVSLDIRQGGPTLVLGPNGAGKTTLLRLLMGLSKPTAGRIEELLGGQDVSLRRAFVFQRPVMLRRTVAANLAFAMRMAQRPATEEAIETALRRVGLAQLASRPARRLSGGEQQRLALARALAFEPHLLLLDEPTASLDPHATKAIEDILGSVAAQGTKIVMSTHDLGQARRLGSDIVFLANGRLVEHAPAPQFFDDPRTEAARRFLAGEIVLSS
jgi:tungstate transport system ATP-binding protein